MEIGTYYLPTQKRLDEADGGDWYQEVKNEIRSWTICQN